MKKKIIIGSIIAVAILIGVSFTSVVGYRIVASDVKASQCIKSPNIYCYLTGEVYENFCG